MIEGVVEVIRDLVKSAPANNEGSTIHLQGDFDAGTLGRAVYDIPVYPDVRRTPFERRI